MSNTKGDKDFVVIEGGQRVGQLHQDQGAAVKEAEERRKLNETQGDKAPPVEIKRNLFG